MKDCKVSVIIPTYKRSDYLTRAVNSVLSQSYENIEVIVVDDNGNDSPFRAKTEQMMKDYYFGNEKVKYIKNEKNIGGANSRNVGAKLASGDFLCFLDDDDVFLPTKIEKQLVYMQENNLDLSFTDIKMYDENDKLVDIRNHSRYIESLENSELLKKHLMYHLTPTDSYMFKREAFFKTGGFKQRIVSQEFMLMLECIESGLKIGYLKGALAVQYIHSGERISSSKKRIEGDKLLFEVKSAYFDRLSAREKRFIRFRFHAVLVVYFLRNKEFIKAAKHAVFSFFISPVFFVKEAVQMLAGLRGKENE